MRWSSLGVGRRPPAGSRGYSSGSQGPMKVLGGQEIQSISGSAASDETGLRVNADAYHPVGVLRNLAGKLTFDVGAPLSLLLGGPSAIAWITHTGAWIAVHGDGLILIPVVLSVLGTFIGFCWLMSQSGKSYGNILAAENRVADAFLEALKLGLPSAGRMVRMAQFATMIPLTAGLTSSALFGGRG